MSYQKLSIAGREKVKGMYNENYYYEEMLKKLETDRMYHENFLYLLEKVEIKRKKDGTHFQKKNQTFVNGRVEIKPYNDSFHPSFVVSGYGKDGKYTSYDIDAYMYVDDMRKANPDDERIQGMKNVNGIMRNTYLLSTDEIIERIEKEKERQRDYIKNYTEQIEASKKLFDIVSEKVQELRETIKENTKQFRNSVFPSSIEYALYDYVKSSIR